MATPSAKPARKTSGSSTANKPARRASPVAEPIGPDPVFHLIETEDHDHGTASPTAMGFWIYLMSDALLFATVFATYGVLSMSFADGPGPRDIFELPLVALNTALLLVSSITYGFAMLAMESNSVGRTQFWLLLTAALGASFVGIELYEFGTLIAEGATPQRSGFLSGFFTLVGTHGAHVVTGIVWIVVMVVQVGQRGLVAANRRRLLCLSMFWHFLDIVWIGVFTFVYLLGMLR